MNWQASYIKQALIKLLETSKIKQGKRLEALINFLLEQAWIATTTRMNEFELTNTGKPALAKFIRAHYPNWEKEQSVVAQMGLQTSNVEHAQFAAKLNFIKRRLKQPLPIILNEKTIQAIWGQDSKTPIPETLKQNLPKFRATVDEAVRIKPNFGFRLLRQDGISIDCDQIVALLHELSVSERALMEIDQACGKLPLLVMTIENKGVFIDINVPESVMLIYAPGNNTALVSQFLSLLMKKITWVHFGDLDSKGIQIGQSLASQIKREYQPFIPNYWIQYKNLYCHPVTTDKQSWHPINLPNHPLLQQLFRENQWMEQECIILDREWYAAIENWVVPTNQQRRSNCEI